MMGIGVLAAIALAVATGYGALRAVCVLLKAAVRWINHELMMRPRERYYRMGGSI